MAKGKTTPAPQVTPHKYTEKEFEELYLALCKQTGFQIAYAPQFVKSRDTGFYSFVIVSDVVPIKDNSV